MLEVLGAVRGAVGADFPVWVKLDSRELGKPVGTTLDDAKQVAAMLERGGADAINVTAYHDVGAGQAAFRLEHPARERGEYPGSSCH